MRTRSSGVFLVLVLILFSGAVRSPSQIPPAAVLRDGLALPVPRGYAEVVVAPNPVEAALALGLWRAPIAGQTALWADGSASAWRTVRAGERGWFADSVLAGCYLWAPLDVRRKTVMILRAKGHEMVYVNGVPRAGNPYCLSDERESWQPDFDYSLLPVELEKGRNELLFRCARGAFRAELFPPPKPVFLNGRDVTLPDLVAGEEMRADGAIVVVNASPKPLRGLVIRARIGDGAATETVVPLVEKLTVRKIRFALAGSASPAPNAVAVEVAIFRKSGPDAEKLDGISLDLRVVEADAVRRETFVSSIDASVQQYAIHPAGGDSEIASAAGLPKALVLSLHGASVEAANQAASYAPKSWAHVVAPTNRRPYGFNWEEWGRLDAIEVLELAKKRYRIDEDRVYLTGHSMGGHGTWHLATLFPDRFAAAGPSAGWISFWTYRFRGADLADTSAVRRMIRRSTAPSETFLHAENLRQIGLYILHGGADDNVPPEESRAMVDSLGAFHRDFVYHEENGAGHWWDRSDEPGADCVDWPPMFDFFARHARPGPERVREIHFATANPGVSARNNWLAIEAQIEQLSMSRADVRFDPGMNRFAGTTRNVSRLAFDLAVARPGAPVVIELDGQTLRHEERREGEDRLWLWMAGGRWMLGGEPWAEHKGSHRYGTFKEALRNRVAFVYGTKGNREENAWAYGKARFDAEKLWYQGNGSVEVLSDADFHPAADPDRSVVLYGNASTNAAWKALLGDSPVQARTGEVRFGGRTIRGRDLCCVFVRPRHGSRTASVAAVSGTGIVGMRIANRLPYLSPGVGLPDCVVFDGRVLTHGDEGVLAAGFFGLDWSVDGGEWAGPAR
jgi:dienelactone hydrolase